MNIFRLAGDMSHLLAILLLIAKIWKSKSVVGLSGKSQVSRLIEIESNNYQILYTVVFLTRYLDLFSSFVSVYNTVMKIVYITCSVATCFFIYHKFKATHNRDDDRLV